MRHSTTLGFTLINLIQEFDPTGELNVFFPMMIHSNPDQSKHLETAKMRLLDVWIDFVNLRAEDYSENSRIPTMVHALFKK